MNLLKTVFLCDDDPDDRFLISNALMEVAPEISIVEAEDGQQLLDVIKNYGQSTSLFLLDMNMPRMNGLETIAQIRATPGLSDIPAIMFSTSSDTQLIKRAISAGVNHYIRKPDTFEGFIEMAQFVRRSYLL
ncbi:response regulator [Dyadobacter flavalbus]|uniref:Response regulator n=1 Tax=Dyadobacter flavalbus TaxID=2579942 RepID=A0A5M8QYK8_9BACT|nr:response regulator [Dyadobacter flavalbus]KAA6439794.1 response regulator [Dyadobacter flavalbus]